MSVAKLHQRQKHTQPRKVAKISSANENCDGENDSKSEDLPKSRWDKITSVGKYILLISLLPAFLNMAALQRESAALHPSPTELFDIGNGQKLFFLCRGNGQPTIILDSPIGMTSDIWIALQERLSAMTTVCRYDRAGLGFSDPPHNNSSSHGQKVQPYTTESSVENLHRLLTISSTQRLPLLFVGTEIGALNARFYAQMYAEEVMGIVMVNPIVEGILDVDNGIWEKFWYGEVVGSIQALQISAMFGISRFLLMLGMINQPLLGENVPEETVQLQKHFLCKAAHLYSAYQEHLSLNDSLRQMKIIRKVKPFPQNIPVSVISGNYYDEQLPSALNKAWAKSEQFLVSKLHEGSKHIVINGVDRTMIFKQPDLVFKHIQRMISQWQGKNLKVMSL